MTTYIITPGYNSAQNKDKVWDTILGVIDVLQERPHLIIEEVLRLEPHTNEELLQEYAKKYLWASREDGTLRIHPVTMEVTQNATGSGEYRTVKEALRRAVCRLVLEHCHREKMEVSISVV